MSLTVGNLALQAINRTGILGIFKSGSDPNFSSSSLQDTIANFEKISNSSASRIAENLIKSGTTDSYTIAQTIAKTGGYTTSQVMKSSKFPLVVSQLQKATISRVNDPTYIATSDKAPTTATNNKILIPALAVGASVVVALIYRSVR